jgi:hypothetical protein
VLQAADAELTVLQVGDFLAVDGEGKPLKKRTIQDALADLEDAGLAASNDPLPGFPGVWSAVRA